MNKILLIEDNLEIRENTSELLQLEGYSIIEARDGNDGLQLARELVPDLVLCDIMMPGMNGYEVYNRLKSEPATATIPFIFLTASVEKKDIAVAFGMGVNGYVRKPFETSELLKEISRCIVQTG